MTRIANFTLGIVAVVGVLTFCGLAEGSDPNLIAHWKFDEGSGTTAYDSAGDNDGTIYGATWTSGQIDGALSFDGNDYVDVPPPEKLDFERTDAYTLSAWYKGDATADTLLSKTDRANNYRGYDIFIAEGYVQPHLVSTWTSNSLCETGTLYPVNDLAWHHIAVTYDGSSSPDGLKIYVDGMEEITTVYSDSLSSTIRNSVSFKIAARSEGDEAIHHLTGEVDDVRIYNRALSASEVEQLYWEGFSSFELAVILIENAIAEKQEALERINTALERESLAYGALEEVLESGDYGDLNKRDIAAALREIESAIRRQQRSGKVLLESIEKLEDSLSALGCEAEPPEPNE